MDCPGRNCFAPEPIQYYRVYRSDYRVYRSVNLRGANPARVLTPVNTPPALGLCLERRASEVPDRIDILV